MKSFKNIVEKLTLLNKTISTMESCTGGGLDYFIYYVVCDGYLLFYCGLSQ